MLNNTFELTNYDFYAKRHEMELITTIVEALKQIIEEDKQEKQPLFIKISENFIEVKGVTEPEAELSINGEAILNTNKGNFSTVINLKKGVNNIVITAKKKYSGQASVLRQILVE